MTEEKLTAGYKAFDKDFKCKDYQFEPGKTYKHDGNVEICASGFHYCKVPFDVFNYRDIDSRFAEIISHGPEIGRAHV